MKDRLMTLVDESEVTEEQKKSVTTINVPSQKKSGGLFAQLAKKVSKEKQRERGEPEKGSNEKEDTKEKKSDQTQRSTLSKSSSRENGSAPDADPDDQR